MDYENNELIKTAVDWWINKITNPEYKCGNVKVVLLPKIINASESNEEKIENFKIKLTNFLRLKLMESSRAILRTEYGPVEDLLKIAKIAKLDISNYDLFPWNTEMLITKNYIIVKEPDTDFEQIYNKNEKKLIKTISK